MKSKLEGYLQDFSLVSQPSSKTINYYNNMSSTNNNNNSISIDIDFKTIEKNINNMESLTTEETLDAVKKLKELEIIYKSSESRKKEMGNNEKNSFVACR